MKRVRPASLFRALLFIGGIFGLVALMFWRIAGLPEPEVIRSTDSQEDFTDKSLLPREDQNLIPADSLLWCGGGAFLATRKTAKERTAFSIYTEPSLFNGNEDTPPASQLFSTWMGDFLAGDAKVEEGILLARERRVELKALIEEDPEKALAISVPLELRRRLPPSVRELLEERIDEEGDFYLGAICFGPKTLKDVNFREVELADGRRLKTYTYGRRLDVASKKGMSLHGVAVDDALALHESPLRLIAAVEKAERGFPENEIAVEMSGEVLRIGEPEELVELFEKSDAAERNPSRICNYPRILGGELTNHQYQVETDPATWQEAQAHALSVKGRLVVINDAVENDVVANLLLDALANTRAFDGGNAVYAWIGASDSEAANGTDENATEMSLNATEGSWKWTDGTDVNASYENWGIGAPETNGLDYAAMALENWEVNSTRKGNSGQWNDLNGSNKLAYVIEFDLGDAPTSISEVNGTKKILVIRARYEEEQTEGVLFGSDGTILIEGVDVNESQTLDDIHDVMNAVSQYYQDNSDGQLILESVATQTVTLEHNSTEYDTLDFGTLMKDARAAAAAANPDWDWENLTRELPIVDNASNVNTTAEEITITSHGLITGDQVLYDKGAAPITGLTDQTEYYVVKVDDDNFALATNGNDASLAAEGNASKRIDLTATGTGGTLTLSSYLSYVVVTKRAHPEGDYGGLAWVGAPGCHVPGWSMGVAAHELGHNFGLSHANYWDAHTESPIGDGFNQEYGNPLSVMGSGGGHLTLAAKRRLDFYLEGRDIAYLVDDNSSPLAVDDNHTFRIYRHDYEKAPYGLKEELFTVDLPAELNAPYSIPPTVKFEGAGGTDANATVLLSSKQVSHLDVTDPGMGFVQEPTVTIVPHEDDLNASTLTLDASWIVNGSGTQNTFLDTDENNSSRGLRGIKLPAGDGNFYWISYRHGFDKNGLTVVWGNASGSQNWLIDMTRETPNSYEDGGARMGRTITDIGSEVHFTPVAHGGEYPSEYIDVVVRVGWNESNNSAPQPDLTVSDFTPAVNETVAFAVDATDADGDLAFAYSWYVDDVMVTEASALNKPSLSQIFSSPGIRKVRVAVSDMKGGVGSATILVRVSEPETHSQSRIEGRVLSGGKPVEGARVFMERSVPIIHPVTVQGSMSDSRIPKYYFDGDESPDLVLYRGQTHRFLFDATAGEHPLRFSEEEGSKAALAKVDGNDANATVFWTPTGVEIIERGYGYLSDLSVDDVRIRGAGNRAPEYEILMEPAPGEPGYFVIKGLWLVRAGEGNYTESPHLVLSGGGEIMEVDNGLIHPPSEPATFSLLADLNTTTYFTVNLSDATDVSNGLAATTGELLSITVNPAIEDFLFSETPAFTVVDEPDGGIIATSVTMQQDFVAAVTVTDGGSGYTRPAEVTFYGGFGTDGNESNVTQATAHALIDENGSISAIEIDSNGINYTSVPEISITGGGGSGASVEVIDLNGSKPVVKVLDGGSGYRNDNATNVLSVGFVGTLLPPDGWKATATAHLGGQVASITVVKGGEKYIAPAVTIAGDGTGATAHAKVKGGRIVKIVIDDPGTGYTDANVTISGGRGLDANGLDMNGTDANCTAIVRNGQIERIIINGDGGSAYFAPLVVVEGTGSGVDAYPVVENGTITRVEIDHDVNGSGSGFTETPTLRLFDFARDAIALYDLLEDDEKEPEDAELKVTLANMQGDEIVWVDVTNGGNDYNVTAPLTLDANFTGNDKDATFDVQISDKRRLWDIDVTATTQPLSFESTPEIYFYHDPNGDSPLEEEIPMDSIHGHGAESDYLDIVVTDDLPNEFYYYSEGWNGVGMGGRVRVVDSSPELHWWNVGDWEADRYYHEGTVVAFEKVGYVCLSSHTSTVFKNTRDITFERVNDLFSTWDAARIDAASHGGILATFLTQAEWNKMLQEVGDINATLFLGGFQPAQSADPGDNWQWVSGEAWDPVMDSNWNTAILPPQPQPFHNPGNVNSHPVRWLVVDKYEKWRVVHDLNHAGSVEDFTINNGGTGYTSIDNVTISGGGGSGAQGNISLFDVNLGGTITDVDVTPWPPFFPGHGGGGDYTDLPDVTITGGGTGAQITAVMTGDEFGYILEYEDKSDLANGYWMRLGQAPWVLDAWQAGEKYHLGDAVKIGDLGEEETYVCLQLHEESSEKFETDLARGYWLRTETDKAVTYMKNSNPALEGFWSVVPQGLETYTDAEGYYAFTDLEHGLYSVGVDVEDDDRQPISYEDQNTTAVLLGGFDELTLQTDDAGEGASSLVWPDELIDSIYGQYFPEWTAGRKYLAYRGFVTKAGIKYVCVEDHVASSTFSDDLNTNWKRADKHLGGIGYGFASEPALTILPDEANTGNGKAVVEVSLPPKGEDWDGTLDLTINDDSNDSKIHDPNDRFVVRTNSWTQGIDFWESGYKENTFGNAVNLVISPNSSLNGIEMPIYWDIPKDGSATFTATLWDADGNLITDGNVTWDLLLDFNASSGDNNSSIKIADDADSKAIIEIASTLRKGQIVAIDLNTSGSGYTSAPTVTILGDGTDATATATVDGGVVTAIMVTAGGSGYSSAPVVALSGGGGTGASAQAMVGGKAVLRADDANSSAYDEVTIIVGNLQVMTPEDIWRDKHFDTILDDFNATFSDSGDADADNLTNAEEFALGTNPLAVDTDGDGISDSVEINGSHTYELINGSFTWTEAKADAESKGGFLATITSLSENDKVTAALDGNSTVWLGGTDSVTEGTWTWDNGESWSYYKWIVPHPINSTGAEDFLVLSSPGEWNASSDGNYSYVLERFFVTDPVLADTDGDGLSDGYEVDTDYNGTTTHPLLVDTDGDGVSDGDEVADGDDPTDKHRTITVSANGIIYYSGAQSGNIYVTHYEVALGTSPGDENVTIITEPGYYTLSNLDFNKTYQPFAFLDANGDGNRSLNEAYGQYEDANFTFAADSFDVNVNLVAPPRILTELMPGEVIGIDLNGSGSGYTDANVTISGGGGSGAEANATIVANAISSITVTNGGSGYVSVPTVTINGDGADATATAVIGYVANYGESFSLQISAEEFPTDFNDSDTLPSWLDLNKTTGLISGTPDETAAGYHDFNVTAKNSASTAESEAAGEGNATFTIFVPDVLPPIITLNGNASINLEVNSSYADAGAVWTDNLDGIGTVDANGTVNVNALGTYYLTYDLNDTTGNVATQVLRTVMVEDTTVPVIVLLGDANVTHEANEAYADARAVWTDNLDGNGTVDANGTVNVNALGTYYLYYDRNDTSENNATQVIRTVTVVDTTSPVIALKGDANVTHEMHATYVDAGATWTDSLDGNGTVDANGAVDVDVPGIYYLTYDLNDSSENNATQVTRMVTVVDATVPEIVLLGDANVTHEANATYVDAGAIWTDNLDGNGTLDANGTVNVAEFGTYYLYYDLNDTSGNAALQVIRAITVVESIAPIITLQGDANATHEANTAYVDAGATWTDNLDGNGTVEAYGMVNATALGVYYLYYDRNDTFGNAASQVIRTVTVVDTTSPVLTLIGDANVTHEANATYVDAGATWTDSVDGNGTVDANGTVTGTVDATAPGVYYLYYDLNDTSQNAAEQVTRTVTVVDTTAPVITLLGETLLAHSSDGAFVDPGANATDFADGNLTSKIETTGTVDAAIPGVYFLYYNVSDAAGNAAAQAIRLVTVVDAIPPVITLLGEAVLAHASDTEFVDPGVAAIDDYDGNLTATMTISGTIDVTTPGPYFLYYDVNDTAGNAASQVMRTVIVEDKTPPTIDLVGASPFDLEVGDQFVDPGAYANDSYEGNLTAEIQVAGTPDISVLGDYFIYYDVNDSSGNAATRVVRTVTVGDSTGPVVTPIGEASVSLMIGETYQELGATAIDAYEGILTADVSDPGQIVDTSKTGEYTITYEATDSSGNAGQAVRIVTISHALVLGGRAIDGYLAGATVIFDGDGDGVHDLVDTNETDSSGEFALAFTASELEKYDKDDNGQIDAVEGIFILSGGVDSSTGTAFDGSLTALPGSTVVTPLTTLIVSLVQQGKDEDEAASLVSQAFGIDSSVDLSSYDPLEKATEADPQAAAVLAAGAQVMNVMLQTAATIDYASNQNLSTAAVSLAVADQLASVVGAATAPIDLASDLETLSTITSSSLAAADPAATLSSSDLTAAVQLTASINDMVADSLAANANNPELLAVDAARIRIVAQEAVTSAVDALDIEGGSLSSVAEEVDSDYLTSYLSNVKATNVFAPTSPDQVFVMARSKLIHGATLRDLNATDKDGTTSSTFAIVTGNFDYDGDGENAFAIDSETGEITVTDPTDLELHPFESVELTVKLTDSGGLSSTTTVRAHVDAPNLLHGEGSSLETDSGWWSVQWFGSFHSLDSGWIYHADQGWLYVSGESTLNSLWLWDPGLEAWIWTNESVYPFVYRHDDEKWLYFGSETASGQYYDYDAEAWIPK